MAGKGIGGGFWLAVVAAACVAMTAGAQVTLNDWGSDAGLVAVHQPDEVGIPLAQDWQTGGLAVGDFNNDGCQDVFWVGGGGTADKLFINNCDGSGTFTNQATAWGLTTLHCGNGAAVGDYDGDGLLDIYVTSFGVPGDANNGPGQHRLYHNDGGSFSDVAGAAGVNRSCSEASGNPAGYGAAWGDYDLDGSLDLCVVSWWGGDGGNRLFHNNGDGTFADVTDDALGAAVAGVSGFQPAFVDMDGDRFPELLISADFEDSRYLVNNRDGTFTDHTSGSGTGKDDNGMGQAVADVNNDGAFEWYVTSIFSETPPPDNPGNMLYWNVGVHSYVEISGFAGVNDGAWGWGTVAVDLDHDTWVDILEVNGRAAVPWANQPARLFHNNTNLTFDDIAATAGFDHAGEGRSLAYLDADRDGDLDILVSTNAGPLAYYRNETAAIGTWLRITLDTSLNPLLAPDGFGTRVIATVGGTAYHRFMSGSPSYLATSELTVHFGFDTATTVDELWIEWTKGYVTVLTDVAVNQHLTIVAPAIGDIDGDGSVGITDFLDILGAWGPCPDPPEPCLADLDNDGEVGIVDFLDLLAYWG
jgi:hypothetical protein